MYVEEEEGKGSHSFNLLYSCPLSARETFLFFFWLVPRQRRQCRFRIVAVATCCVSVAVFLDIEAFQFHSIRKNLPSLAQVPLGTVRQVKRGGGLICAKLTP